MLIYLSAERQPAPDLHSLMTINSRENIADLRGAGFFFQDVLVMCALTVHGNLPGKAFVYLEAFPVAVICLLLLLLLFGEKTEV